MPYQGRARKKTRTHVVEPVGGAAGGEKAPRSFVLRRGKVDRTVKELVEDMRELMAPHTAARLRERKRNTLKDFVSAAGALNVSHLLMFAQSEGSGNVSLRVGRLPRGPTLTFRVDSYTTARQVRASQKRQQDVSKSFLTPPLLVLHGFGAAEAAGGGGGGGSGGVGAADALKMARVTLQAMLPSVNPATVRLPDCRRVLLVHHDPATGCLLLRHYLIRARPVGLSRGVGRLLSPGGRAGGELPNLGGLRDVAQYLLGASGGYGSESEAEDGADARVMLPPSFPGLPGGGGGGSRKRPRSEGAGAAGSGRETPSSLSALRLTEIGPRLTLRVVKVVAGLCEGEVLYHALVKKSAAEKAALRAGAAERAQLKEARVAVQKENVERKAATEASKKAVKKAKKEARQAAAERAAAEGRLGDDDEGEGGASEGGAGREDGSEVDDEGDGDVEVDDGADEDAGDAEVDDVRGVERGGEDGGGSGKRRAPFAPPPRAPRAPTEDSDSEGTDPGQQGGHAVWRGGSKVVPKGGVKRSKLARAEDMRPQSSEGGDGAPKAFSRGRGGGFGGRGRGGGARGGGGFRGRGRGGRGGR
jgi:ribosome biogenesis protein SSF1/2